MLGLRNSTQEIPQSPSDYTCSSIHKLRAPSSPLLLHRKMSIPLRMRVWHLHLVWEGFPSYTSAIVDALSTVRIHAGQVVMPFIILLTSLVQTLRQLHLEGVRRPLSLLTRAVMPLPMHNWRQWMSITSLMAGKHPILIPPPLETRGNSRSAQTHTLASLKECAVRYHMIHITAAAPVQALYLPRLPLMPVVLVHLITAILREGCKLPRGLQALIVRLTLIPGNRAGMVPRVIERLVGIVVSGANVGIRVVGGVDHRILRGHLRLLGP